MWFAELMARPSSPQPLRQTFVHSSAIESRRPASITSSRRRGLLWRRGGGFRSQTNGRAGGRPAALQRSADRAVRMGNTRRAFGAPRQKGRVPTTHKGRSTWDYANLKSTPAAAAISCGCHLGYGVWNCRVMNLGGGTGNPDELRATGPLPGRRSCKPRPRGGFAETAWGRPKAKKAKEEEGLRRGKGRRRGDPRCR